MSVTVQYGPPQAFVQTTSNVELKCPRQSAQPKGAELRVMRSVRGGI
jgi:hypothetical protein